MLTHKQKKYWAYRMRTAALGGAPADGCPEEFAPWAESQQIFGGWQNYTVTWDICCGGVLRSISGIYAIPYPANYERELV